MKSIVFKNVEYLLFCTLRQTMTMLSLHKCCINTYLPTHVCVHTHTNAHTKGRKLNVKANA